MSDYFPSEIIQEILKRLPTKCLIKCTSVCKSWRSLIQSSAFIHNHLSRTIQPNNPNDAAGLLLLRASAGDENSALYSLHWDNPETGEYCKLVNPYPYIKAAIFTRREIVQVRNFHVVGACNGLVCLAIDFAYFGCQMIIWNPCVRKFITLPKLSVSVNKNGRHRASYAFGYDSRANDYKVVRINGSGITPCEVEVWSFASGGCWKSLSAPHYSNLALGDFGQADKHAFVNGALHWVQRRNPKTGEGRFILWFDISTELFGEIMIPQGLTKENFFVLRYEESLALLEIGHLGGHSYEFNIWVMKEYGVAESWTKLFTVHLQGLMQEPLCFKRNSELVFKMIRRNLLTVDLKTEELKYIEIVGYTCDFMDSFVESLVLLGQANAISY